MPEPMTSFFAAPVATADRPLGGVTILLVEDSRFASEAVRLLGMRSGARIRRADCLRTAERHLATYRPTVVLVDLGLPDGSGIDLIRRLDRAVPRLPAILATSGDEALEQAALAAGADGFLAKPCIGLAAFQSAVLAALKTETPAMTRVSATDRVVPDVLAYRDDLAGVSELLSAEAQPTDVAYAARFLAGVARSADDPPLAEAAAQLWSGMTDGGPTAALIARVAGLVEQRLHGGGARSIA
jgi:CheY-like chemotaxis protein